MHNKPLDILSINKTRLDGNISDNYIEISGYDVLRNDRNREGGCVAIYFIDFFNTKNRDELVPDCFEAICVEITKKKMCASTCCHYI